MLHVLYVLHLCCIISLRYLIMKLWFDKRLSDPTYYVQIGVRNGKKVTSKNIAKIGKHSELLKQDAVSKAQNACQSWRCF